MVTEQGPKDRKVVIDACAAIKLQRLDRFGGELYTTGGVIREIKDENARAMLKTLPQEINVKEPLAQDIAFTKNFAKMTGDLGFLSQNDIELIALTIALHREAGGKVQQRPAQLETLEGTTGFDWAPAAASKPIRSNGPTDQGYKAEAAPVLDEDGFEAVTKSSKKRGVTHFTQAPAQTSVADVLAAVAEAEEEADDSADQPAAGENPAAASSDAAPEASADATPKVEGAAKDAESDIEDDEVSDDDSEDGSSAGEWVTAENKHRFGIGVEAPEDVKATCATADYSVQNVLLQMGITPLTFDGYAVRSVKLWGLICRACNYFDRDTQRVFCAKCGNDTVVRVPIIVDQDGKPSVLNNGRKLRTKGTVYSIPKPQGGRGWKPLYSEDEIYIGGRDRQLRHSQKLQDKERQNRDPFNDDNACRAWYQRGNTSGCRGGPADLPRMKAGLGRVNPNANNYKFKNGKKK